MRKYLFLASCLLFICAVVCGQGRTEDSLIRVLDTISQDDQVYRVQLEDQAERHGGESKEVKTLFVKMRLQDSINQLKVKAILDRYGWLGPEIIGEDGNTTLFMVVQHADLSMQVKYLPMMRDAVSKGKAKAKELALLEDRVALRQGRKQIYGSQVGWDMKHGWRYMLPLEDPEQVDKRRAAVGLPPLSEYLQNWQMKWDVEQYKRDLQRIDSLYHSAFHI